MSYPLTQLGGRAFNHTQSQRAEAEYDRLRSLASQEASKRQQCFDKAHSAYERGDGAAAHALSEQGKRHAAKMDDCNRQAAEFIFRENNAEGRVRGDEIDLHGLFVEEAEAVLESRIRAARGAGQEGLHVIVGKGNHSANHVQKLKPAVERMCRELGLQYMTEDNVGRIHINLQGGQVHIPSQHHGGQQGYPGHQEPHHGGGGHHQQQGQHDGLGGVEQKLLPKLFKALRGCCTVM
ncbi:DUF1771-domain-containing protein [Patellaria atrata CBS 101060]|uniref:DUF1771-domain-containing protein n=1 Tax=Patellaria atrata CBS 101060 TaxID=1346257 RepID=A0A9P4S992_9PEZI|nr:DUF1771-domain-containing protein [Patellaria atrata CBS 101060]